MPLSLNFEKGTIVRLISVQVILHRCTTFIYFSLWKKYIKLYSLPQFCIRNSMKSFSMSSFPSLLDLPSPFPLPHATLCFRPALNPATGVREGGVLSSVLLYSFDPPSPTPPKILFCHLWLSSVSSPPSVAPSPQPLYINKMINLFSILRKERNL